MVKEAKFVDVDDGEFAFAITDDDELKIIDVEREEEKIYSNETVNELMDFLNKYWEI